MPKQKKGSGQARFISKNQHARQQRQKTARSLVVLIIAVIIVAVLGVVGWSVYNFQVRPYRQAVIRFNGQTFDMRYFTNMLKLYYGKAPSDTSIDSFADYVEQQIERNETIIQGSKALGVEVSRGDIEQIIRNAGLPVTREQVDVTMAADLLNKQVPASQPQAHVQAMLLESEAAAQAALARVRAGESFVTTANETSKLPEGKVYEGELGWVTPREADLTVGSTKFGAMFAAAANGTLNGPLYDDTVSKQFGYWIAKAVELQQAADNTTLDQMHLMGVLLGSEQDAQDAINQLNAGADINDLAKKLSQATGAADNGADIGWIVRGQDPGGFGRVFDLPLNTVIGPISENMTNTTGGWWVFKIVEKDPNRELSGPQQKTLEQDFMDRCTAALKKDPNYKVENLLTQETKDFALNAVVSSLGKGAILIGTGTLPDGEVGVSYTYQIKAYGDTAGSTWSMTDGTLPTGLALNTATGVISGKPEMAGGSGFTVKVTSKVHHDTKDLVLRIHLPLSIATTLLPEGQVGTVYSVTLTAFGDSDTVNWTVIEGALPDGIQLSSASGILYGTPTKSGAYRFTVQADDGLKQVLQELTLTVP